MDKTTVSAKFFLIGDIFEPLEITSILEITPTRIGKKGEKIRDGKLERKETFWELSTSEQNSYDINDQIEELTRQVIPVKEKLKEVMIKYELEGSIRIVIKIENNEKPAMYLEPEFINLISDLGFGLDFDLYIYS